MRAFVAVLDSLGIGGAPDAKRFGDSGANTFGHVLHACAEGKLVRRSRAGALAIPHLTSLGLLHAAHEAAPQVVKRNNAPTVGLYGYAVEKSRGKDSVSGHWEMMGLPLETAWGTFPDCIPAFPEVLTDMLAEKARLPGILGDCRARGTEILDRFGEEHIESGKPICYAAYDSVFQIAAHEDHFGLDRLYMVCRIARKLVNEYNVFRVIARPFVGERRGQFAMSANRRDYAAAPHKSTLPDRAKAAGREVIGIGRIAELFAGSGITKTVRGVDNAQIFDALLESVGSAPDGALILANFADFDRLFGHKRDVAGYAGALEDFDARLPEFLDALRPGDLAVFTADHGCDPAFRGAGHTRECVPILAYGPGLPPGAIGRRQTFADIAQTLARHLDLPPMTAGTGFLG